MHSREGKNVMPVERTGHVATSGRVKVMPEDRVWVIDELVPTINKYLVKARTRGEALRKFKTENVEAVEWIGFVIQDFEATITDMHGPFASEKEAREDEAGYTDGPEG